MPKKKSKSSEREGQFHVGTSRDDPPAAAAAVFACPPPPGDCFSLTDMMFILFVSISFPLSGLQNGAKTSNKDKPSNHPQRVNSPRDRVLRI